VLLLNWEKIVMQTASAILCNENNLVEEDARIFLDSGSQRTCIKEIKIM
jgi:hypothetical protein